MTVKMHERNEMRRSAYKAASSARMVGAVIAVSLMLVAGCAEIDWPAQALRAGEDGRGPWWMQQTAITREGKLTLTDKPWWPRAAQLKVGESFVVTRAKPQAAGTASNVIPAEGTAVLEGTSVSEGLMLVRREKVQTRNRELEAIVWIIDDDSDGSVLTGGDQDADCYIVDYDGDGIVDRMVDYIDNDGDNDPDEMDIRYFVDGELRYCWFGEDLDDDSAMWSLTGYEYGGPSFFEADPYGDGIIYMNKLDPEKGIWAPISECPFAFYDTDGDGYSEVIIRVSAVPINYDVSVDPDYANDYRRFAAPWSPEMRQMGIVNIRYSFDVDNLSGPDRPLHYDFGFNLVGATPYRFPGMWHYNAKRRPPQAVCVTPHQALREISDRYQAEETGFSWVENFDDTTTIGHGAAADEDWRWEGVFWIWERRFMENTGGPCQKWNVRREWSRRPTDRRELYYSGVDGRIHLFGAEEGWIEIGHFAGLGAIGETRMFDTDGNGFFDRWEVYLGDQVLPVRVITVRDEKAWKIPFEEQSLRTFYTQKVLPDAIDANTRLIEAMYALREYQAPEGLIEALQAGPPGHRRYAQDVILELQYQELRRTLSEAAHKLLRGAKMNDLRTLKTDERATTANTQTAWAMLRALQRLDVALGEGSANEACDILAEIAALRKIVGP